MTRWVVFVTPSAGHSDGTRLSLSKDPCAFYHNDTILGLDCKISVLSLPFPRAEQISTQGQGLQAPPYSRPVLAEKVNAGGPGPTPVECSVVKCFSTGSEPPCSTENWRQERSLFSWYLCCRNLERSFLVYSGP